MTLIRAERVNLAKSKQGTATGHFPVQARLLKQCSGRCPMTPENSSLQAVPGRRQKQADKTPHRSPPLGQTVNRRTLTSNQAHHPQAFPVRSLQDGAERGKLGAVPMLRANRTRRSPSSSASRRHCSSQERPASGHATARRTDRTAH